jgi:hypothetical protein
MSNHKKTLICKPISKKYFALFLVICFGFMTLLSTAHAADNWYKGNTHMHSFWSDGDTLPELAIDWYRQHNYQFVTPSDHNLLQEGQRWIKAKRKTRPVTPAILEQAKNRFGDNWLETRGEGDQLEVRLKTHVELKNHFDKPEKFLVIQAEEITGDWADRTAKKDGKPDKKPRKRQVHVNAINLVEPIQPQKGKTLVDTIRNDLLAVQAQSKKHGLTILAHLNHPSWPKYDIDAQTMADVEPLQFVEFCNNAPNCNSAGDAENPSCDRIWDITNTLRLAKGWKPTYGTASDDTHSYNKLASNKANPGRGWIVVRAGELSTNAILQSMLKGDFYASTGVVLKKLEYDPKQKTLSIAVDPIAGVNYTIEFIGTKQGTSLEGKGKPKRYSPKIGEVLARHEATEATYQIKGNEMYVRATVRSDQKIDHPPTTGIKTGTAWTQPVGWEKE